MQFEYANDAGYPYISHSAGTDSARMFSGGSGMVEEKKKL